jgi:hypothetical protein
MAESLEEFYRGTAGESLSEPTGNENREGGVSIITTALIDDAR